jgi:hypothetical protein
LTPDSWLLRLEAVPLSVATLPLKLLLTVLMEELRLEVAELTAAELADWVLLMADCSETVLVLRPLLTLDIWLLTVETAPLRLSRPALRPLFTVLMSEVRLEVAVLTEAELAVCTLVTAVCSDSVFVLRPVATLVAMEARLLAVLRMWALMLFVTTVVEALTVCRADVRLANTDVWVASGGLGLGGWWGGGEGGRGTRFNN